MREKLKGALYGVGWHYLLMFVAGAALALIREGLATGNYNFGGSWWFIGDAILHGVGLMFFSLFVGATAEKLKWYFFVNDESTSKLDDEDYQFLTAVFVIVGSIVVLFFAALPDGALKGSDEWF